MRFFFTRYMIPFIMILSWSLNLQAQRYMYEEERGDELIYYHYDQQADKDYTIRVARIIDGDTTDKHVLVTDQNFKTLSWHYIRFGEHTDVLAKRTPEGVSITGYLDDDELDEFEELDDDEPWIQLFPMNPGMEQFIKSDKDEIVFWSIGTESPADMEINSFKAEKEESGYNEEFGCKVLRVNFSPTGWKSYFWDGDYYFRLDDGRIVGYRGDGAPGKASSKTTLIKEY